MMMMMMIMFLQWKNNNKKPHTFVCVCVCVCVSCLTRTQKQFSSKKDSLKYISIEKLIPLSTKFSDFIGRSGRSKHPKSKQINWLIHQSAKKTKTNKQTNTKHQNPSRFVSVIIHSPVYFLLNPVRPSIHPCIWIFFQHSTLQLIHPPNHPPTYASIMRPPTSVYPSPSYQASHQTIYL